MMINRRSLLTSAVLAWIPPSALASAPVVLHGDGINDDSDAFDALASGRPVKLHGDGRYAAWQDPKTKSFHVGGGKFRLSRTLHIRPDDSQRWSLVANTFTFRP